jgi:hypothetical protein
MRLCEPVKCSVTTFYNVCTMYEANHHVRQQPSIPVIGQCRPLRSSCQHPPSTAVRWFQGYEGPMPSNHPPVRPSTRPTPSTEAAVAAGKQAQLSSTARLVTYTNANIWTANIEVKGCFQGCAGSHGFTVRYWVLSVLLSLLAATKSGCICTVTSSGALTHPCGSVRLDLGSYAVPLAVPCCAMPCCPAAPSPFSYQQQRPAAKMLPGSSVPEEV